MCQKKSIAFSIKSVSNQIKRYIDYQTEQTEQPLTGMQHAVIGFVGKNSPERELFQKDLEAEFNIRRSTATGILQLMEKNGLIKRVPVSHDARLKKIVLTQKATSIFQEVGQKIDETEQVLRNGLSEEEINTFFQLLEKISNNLETRRKPI